jgi:hypothetical protein
LYSSETFVTAAKHILGLAREEKPPDVECRWKCLEYYATAIQKYLVTQIVF